MTSGILTTRRIAKPWGRRTLPEPFDQGDDERIGEIWFEPPAQFDALLAKYLFTSDKLSVQVHPSDAQAPDGRGKEECWLILDAKPDAKLAAGFRREVSQDEMRAAALDGSVEDLLCWHEVAAGDFLYIPAGTVHAIGPGISLVEIQQNCDITYRFFDYGRPRELHLDQAVAVAQGKPHPPSLRRHVEVGDDAVLVDGPLFRVAQCRGEPDRALAASFDSKCLIMPLEGEVTLGELDLAAGMAGWTSDIQQAVFAPEGRYLLAAPVTRPD